MTDKIQNYLEDGQNSQDFIVLWKLIFKTRYTKKLQLLEVYSFLYKKRELNVDTDLLSQDISKYHRR